MRNKIAAFSFTLLVISSLTFPNKIQANDDYHLVDPSELSFSWKLKDDILESGIVQEYIHPTFGSRLYMKPLNATVVSFLCNGKTIELANNQVEDGFISTIKFGKIKVGIINSPSPTLIVWLTEQQKKELLSLKQN